jgi:hypothetical protein
MKFIADTMLGRLARWLRLLGFDTRYFPRIEDSLLLRIAREEKRIVLTRDTRLIKTRGMPRFFLIEDNSPFMQLKSVLNAFDIDAEKIKDLHLSRCVLCNALLCRIEKHQVKGLVPEYVYQTCDNFKKCPECGKLYWKGTHPEKFQNKLKEILQK